MIVGIDISKSTFDASWIDSKHEMHKQYKYTESGINDFLKEVPNDSHFIMEATGAYHTLLALRLYESGRKVSVCNPLVIKRFSQMKLTRAKTDKADARLVRRYGEENKQEQWLPEEADILELKQAHGWLNDLIQERTRLLNRQEAHAYQVKRSSFVIAQMKSQLKQLNQQIDACEKHLEVIAKKSFADLYSRLITIPSIGPKTAIELIVVTGGFKRFENIKALSAYIGVSPTNHESGVSVKGKGHIAKMGSGRIRQLLYLCTWTAKRCNRSCRELYARLKASGKPAKVINIAIAHKLLRQAFAVATKQVSYSENYA